jgi:hypothetical protein
LISLGPFYEISADGHEKMNAQALRMGDLSLPIYAYRDKWSGFLLKISVVPNSRTAASIGHLFLDLIAQYGGMPVSSLNLVILLSYSSGNQVFLCRSQPTRGAKLDGKRSSKKRSGMSELYHQIYNIVDVNGRTMCAPDVDIHEYPPCVALKSVHNTIIEGLWRWFEKTTGKRLKLLVMKGLEDRIFHPHRSYHS